jgi:hypothetical protein
LVVLKGESIHGECSAREASKRTSIPLTSVWRIMRQQLNLYPYRPRCAQEPKPANHLARKAFSEYCLNKMDEDCNWLNKILLTDEAHFYLHGGVNAKDCIIWAQEKPNVVLPKPLHDEKLQLGVCLQVNLYWGHIFLKKLIVI